MDRKVKREILATLVRAGRRDLAETVAAEGAKTKQFVDRVTKLLQQHDMKLQDSYVADNRGSMSFKGLFGKKARATDPKQFGGLAGKPFRLDVTVRAGSQVWVTLTAFRGKVQRSFALPGRDLDAVFTVVEKATKEMLDEVLQ